VKASPTAGQQKPALENVRMSPADDTAGTAAERDKTRMVSRSENDDADVKKKKDLSDNEEVLLLFLFFH